MKRRERSKYRRVAAAPFGVNRGEGRSIFGFLRIA
jgi:hypothetical protein